MSERERVEERERRWCSYKSLSVKREKDLSKKENVTQNRYFDLSFKRRRP